MSETRCGIMFALLLLGATTAQASGLLVPRNGGQPIRLRSQRVTATLTDGLARTTVRQTFIHEGTRPLEAIYLFPVPEQAALVDLVLELGDQRLEGLLVERRAARRAYNSITRRGRDPALLEQIGRSRFRLSVFPVLPKQPTVVELTWIETLPLSQGAYTYVYPLGLKGAASRTEQDFTLTLNVESSAPIQSIESSLEDIHLREISANQARASLERDQALLSEDIVIITRISTPKPRLDLRVYRPSSGPAYFACVITPPELQRHQILARDLILALDVSGSMRGEKLEQARRAALWLLDHLNPGDRIELLLFNDTLHRLTDGLVEITERNRSDLRRALAQTHAKGSTALGDVIADVHRHERSTGRVALAVILTDGYPTVGEARPERIVGFARAGAERGLRTFTFGVGSEVNAALLEAVSLAGAGRAEIFRQNGEIETRLRAFLTRTASPVVVDLRIEIDGTAVDDLLPRPLPNLYLGEQALITGRFRGEGQHELTARGRLGGQEVVLTSNPDFGRTGNQGQGDAVARDLFARQKLAFLEQALRLRRNLPDGAYFAALARNQPATGEELLQAQIELSLETGVQCPHTSFLALLPEDRQRLRTADRKALDEAVRRVRARSQELAGREGPAHAVEEALFEAKGPVVTAAPLGVGGGSGRAYGGRYGGRGAASSGGRAMTPVSLSLRWLAQHQEPNGHWSATDFSDLCRSGRCDGAGQAGHDVGLTGLSLLVFLGAEHTMNRGPHKRTVKNAVRYLMSIQEVDTGRLGSGALNPDTLRDHALATLALTEAYGLSKWPLLKDAALHAVQFLRTHYDQAPQGWAALALQSARDFGLLREAHKDQEIVPILFRGKFTSDLEFLYFRSLAAFRAGGAHRKKYERDVLSGVVPRQVRKGEARGSFDPTAEEPLPAGGRVETTALSALCLMPLSGPAQQ